MPSSSCFWPILSNQLIYQETYNNVKNDINETRLRGQMQRGQDNNTNEAKANCSEAKASYSGLEAEAFPDYYWLLLKLCILTVYEPYQSYLSNSKTCRLYITYFRLLQRTSVDTVLYFVTSPCYVMFCLVFLTYFCKEQVFTVLAKGIYFHSC